MEQVRMPSTQPQAAAKAPTTAESEERSAADEAGTTKKQGFALLLAALDVGEAPALPLSPASQAPVGEADTVAADALQAGGDTRDAALVGATGLTGSGAGQAPAAPDLPDTGQPTMSATAQHTPDAPDQGELPLLAQLSMLLNQGLHTLAGQGLQANLMVKETARMDAGEPQIFGGTARKGAAGAQGRLAAQAGAALAGGLPLAAGKDMAAAVAGADARNAGLPNAASATGQDALASALQQVADADPRVALHEAGAVGARAANLQAGAALAPIALDAAMAGRLRSTPAVSADAQGGGAAGGDAAMQQPALQQQGAAAPDASGGAGPGDGMPGSFMEQLGEQVAFWVHQKTQRAEFTLDRDGQPVQVQLALTGDVARITFLTDHDAARQALDAGAQDLRELLGQQGLALADVNVGVAGERGSGASGQRDQAAAREGGVRGTARVELPGQAGAARPRADSRRALDIFV